MLKFRIILNFKFLLGCSSCWDILAFMNFWIVDFLLIIHWNWLFKVLLCLIKILKDILINTFNHFCCPMFKEIHDLFCFSDSTHITLGIVQPLLVFCPYFSHLFSFCFFSLYPPVLMLPICPNCLLAYCIFLLIFACSPSLHILFPWLVSSALVALICYGRLRSCCRLGMEVRIKGDKCI